MTKTLARFLGGDLIHMFMDIIRVLYSIVFLKLFYYFTVIPLSVVFRLGYTQHFCVSFIFPFLCSFIGRPTTTFSTSSGRHEPEGRHEGASEEPGHDQEAENAGHAPQGRGAGG